MASEYDAIKHLSSALFPYDQKERLMAFVTAYFDESYANPNTTVYTVAGYISADHRWVKFQKSWMGLLRQEVQPQWLKVHGPDKKLFFHMTDFDNPHSKIYGDWTARKKVWFLKELHKVIKKAYFRSFSTGIIVADYDTLTDEQKYAVGSPHVCAAVNCAKQVAAWASRENRYHSILYVFEKGTVHDKELNRLFNVDLDDKARAYYRIEKLALGDKREFPPLQAADVLAVETRKEIERILQTVNPRKVRESIKNLTVPALDEWLYLDAFHLKGIFKDQLAREQMDSEEFKASFAASKWKPRI